MRPAILVGVSILFFAVNCFSQGSLAPPGAPSPTMKTLDQVEPRTPISSAGTVISQSGSYYLTTNLNASGTTAGITISASDVTLDLNGFTISGASATGNGVFLSIGVNNVLIENGTIRECDGNGIIAGKTTGCIFRDLRVMNNSDAGISGGYNTVIEGCAVKNNGGRGIHGVSGSRVVGNIIEDNAVGLYLSGTDNYVEGNTVKDNVDNYDFAAGNQLNLLLCEIPETLDWPCSVKLAGTLTCSQTYTNGITVNSDNVTIDMDGHSLIGPGESSGHGIYQSLDYRNLTVVNGKVAHWRGSAHKGGLYLAGHNGILESITAQTNHYGIRVGYNWSLRACVASENTEDGIYVNRNNTLKDCSSKGNGERGIYAGYCNTLQNCAAYGNNYGDGICADYYNTLQNCAVHDNNYGSGISANYGNTLLNCTASDNSVGIYLFEGNSIQNCASYNNTAYGVWGIWGNTIENCNANNNTGDGFHLYTDNRMTGCIADGNGYLDGDGAGIHLYDETASRDNRVEGNNVTDNDRGIEVNSPGNFIVRNTCSGNTTNWVVAAGNVCLVVNASTTGSAISGDAGGTSPGSTDPNANFTY